MILVAEVRGRRSAIEPAASRAVPCANPTLAASTRPPRRKRILPTPARVLLCNITRPNATAQVDGQRAAYCIIRGLTDPLRTIYLQRICVDLAAHRGRGIGMALLLRVIHFAFESCDAQKLHLNTQAYNARGRHVYEKAGFVLEGLARDVGLDKRVDHKTGEVRRAKLLLHCGFSAAHSPCVICCSHVIQKAGGPAAAATRLSGTSTQP